MKKKETVHVGAKVKKAPLFTITIKTEHAQYNGEGVTALDALKAIPAIEVVTSSELVIAHGDKRKEMLFSGQQLKRLLNEYNMEVLLNDLVLGL